MKVYAIPGLGTNHLIFEKLKLRNHELVVLEWPPLEEEYSMSDYARCFIDQLDTREPFVILGLSFGGMIAIELSKLVKPQKTILISSAKTREGLSWTIRFFKYFPLHRLVPDWLLRKMAYRSRLILGFWVQYMPRLAEMIKTMPAGYFKYAIKYIVSWDNTTIPPNTVLIHGTHDKLIWLNETHADKVVKGGTHGMVITMGKEVSDIVNEILELV